MANDKRFIVKNGIGTPNVRFANGSNTTAVMEMNYGADGTLVINSNSALGQIIKISDSNSNVLTVNGNIAFGTSGISINATFYEATANNASYAFGKQETQLSVANAVFATTANNALRLNGKQESQLSVNSAAWATTANNSTYAYGKQEGQLSVNSATWAITANNSTYAYGKQEGQLSTNNSVYLAGRTWETAGAVGATVANTGNFTIANTTNYLSLRNIAHLSADSNTTVSVAQVQIASFSANTYGSAKIYIQATEAATNVRHVTELLVVHNNVTASATEYGMLFTGSGALATYEVDISGNNVRVLATPASANSISFRVSEQLFLQ